MREHAWRAGLTCVLGMLLTTGCLERKSSRIGPNVNFGQEIRVGGGGVSAVELMFVIDNSGSMSQEQANLAVQIPALVRDLASPPDRDGDGSPDWNPAEQLRVGVVTTDVGTGNTQLPRSFCVPGGDDGGLQGGVFTWNEGDDADAFAASLRTVVEGLGTQGCAFEQPLEAAARAVARAPETGFPAADGLLAVIVVTDEEDCSVEDDDTFLGAAQAGALNVHCTRNRASLTPVSELLDRIRGERSESEFVFAAIAGFPRGLSGEETPGQILSRDDMQHREVILPNDILPEAVCEFTDASGESLGKAQPARRLAELAQALPDSVLTTICTDDFGPAIERIATRIGSQIPGVCLVRGLPADPDGRVPCEARVAMPEGMGCAARPGYFDVGVDENGAALCVMSQVGFEQPGGFFYDPDRDGCAQLVIAEDARPPLGAELTVECFVTLLAEDGALCARGSQCESGYCDPIGQVCGPLPASEPPLGGEG